MQILTLIFYWFLSENLVFLQNKASNNLPTLPPSSDQLSANHLSHEESGVGGKYSKNLKNLFINKINSFARIKKKITNSQIFPTCLSTKSSDSLLKSIGFECQSH